MDGGRLPLAGDDQRFAAVLEQVERGGFDEARDRLVLRELAGVRAGARRAQLQARVTEQAILEQLEEGRHVGGAQREAVVGDRADRGEARLDRVDAVHRAGLRPASLGQLRAVAHAVGVVAQEVRVEGEDAARAAEVVARAQRTAGGGLEAAHVVLVARRFPDDPLGLREALEQLRAEARVGRAAGRARDHGDAGALVAAAGVEVGREGRLELVPARRRTVLEDLAAALGVVELEDGRLRVDVRRAVARRVQRVALDLDRTTVVGRHAQALRRAEEVHRGGVGLRRAGHEVLGARGEGQDLLFFPVAAGGGGERGGRAHQLQEATAVDALERLRRDVLELARRRLGEDFVTRVFAEAAPGGLGLVRHASGDRWSSPWRGRCRVLR